MNKRISSDPYGLDRLKEKRRLENEKSERKERIIFDILEQFKKIEHKMKI